MRGLRIGPLGSRRRPRPGGTAEMVEEPGLDFLAGFGETMVMPLRAGFCVLVEGERAALGASALCSWALAFLASLGLWCLGFAALAGFGVFLWPVERRALLAFFVTDTPQCDSRFAKC